MENEHIVEEAGNIREYQEKISKYKYVANMEKNKKVLHIAGNQGCYQSSALFTFIGFNTKKEADEYIPKLAECQICFPLR